LIGPQPNLWKEESLYVRGALALIFLATGGFSISNLLSPVLAGVPPLSGNSEFFAYSWVYAIRWGAGEPHVFQPHSQLIYPIYALINHLFAMTTDGADHILAGWRRISLVWPIAMTVSGLAFLFSTISRQAPIIDAAFSASAYLLAVPLFLSDHALNSLSYHSLAIPLALGALPLWRSYRADRAPPSPAFYILLGLYTAICALGKPTFLAFATPLYAMEIVRAIRTRNIWQIILAGLIAIAVYLLWMLAFGGGLDGLIYQLSRTYEFMRSQSSMYNEAKGTTPFHFYSGYVIGVMGPLPTLMIAMIVALILLCRDRAMIASGACVGVASALFCLYQRPQLHAEAEFISLLLAIVVAMFRCASIPERVQRTISGRTIALGGAASAVVLMVCTFAFPPQIRLRGFGDFMNQFDNVVVPHLFEQPQSVRTIALQIYPTVFWGVADAWCRGSNDIFGSQPYSTLLDRAFGNITCMHNVENPNIDIASYNRAMFTKSIQTSLTDAIEELKQKFPNVVKRFLDCREIDVVHEVTVRFEVFECRLRG
jgi:hypothetical protein